MPTFLHALCLKNYRGIGSAAQIAAPLKECNFFIGANNAGKSTFLNFISQHINTVVAGKKTNLSLGQWEVHVGRHEGEVGVAIGFPLQELREKALSSYGQGGGRQWTEPTLKLFVENLASGDFVWVTFDSRNLDQRVFSKASTVKSGLDKGQVYQLWQQLTGNSNGDLEKHWIPQILDWIMRLISFSLPNAHLIPAMRRISAYQGQEFDDFSGKGLIGRLAELQNPGPAQRDLHLKFTQINNFLKEITVDNEIQIEVPWDRSELLVHKDGRVLPLSSLGTGIHEVVMIAAFCTLIEKSLVCIEEPEVHLHPLLQKKLIQYLMQKTSNQYFIATHSASIIDQPGAAVFHVTQEGGTTAIELAAAPSQRFRVCQELGYKASDLLQTNFILWVEGPTDRMYLKHWIDAVDAKLQEGVHYSIMFYGGRLLSHLSAGDQDIDEFISLRRLNRNMAIVIDSDKSAAQTPVNDTKKRVMAEFSKHSEIAWVTAGREIENYLPTSLLTDVLKRLYPKFDCVVSDDRYAHRLMFHDDARNGEAKLADKVKVARAVCSTPAQLDVLDLQKKLGDLVSAIRLANE